MGLLSGITKAAGSLLGGDTIKDIGNVIDNLHSNPANINLRKRVSILTYITNWTYIKRSINRFICSGVCDVLNKNNWWVTLEQKLTFHLLKKHYIDDFTGDRSRVDNHIFYHNNQSWG